MILLTYLRTCKTRRSHSDYSFYGNHNQKNTRKIEGCVQNYGCMLSVFLLRFFLKSFDRNFPSRFASKRRNSKLFQQMWGCVFPTARPPEPLQKHTLLRVLLSPKWRGKINLITFASAASGLIAHCILYGNGILRSQIHNCLIFSGLLSMLRSDWLSYH